MRRILWLLCLVAVGLLAYSHLSDPVKRNKFFVTIEESTGMDLKRKSKKIVIGSAPVINDAADRFLNDITDTFNNEKLQQELNRRSRDALKKLDPGELKNLIDDLQREITQGTENFNRVLNEYTDR